MWLCALLTVELSDGVHQHQDSKTDIAFCDPFKGLIIFCVA